MKSIGVGTSFGELRLVVWPSCYSAVFQIFWDLPTWVQMQGEWPSGLYSLRQVNEVKLGRVRSDFGWVTTAA